MAISGVTQIEFSYRFMGHLYSASTDNTGTFHVGAVSIMSGATDVVSTGTFALVANHASVTVAGGFNSIANILSGPAKHVLIAQVPGFVTFTWTPPSAIDLDSLTLTSPSNNCHVSDLTVTVRKDNGRVVKYPPKRWGTLYTSDLALMPTTVRSIYAGQFHQDFTLALNDSDASAYPVRWPGSWKDGMIDPVNRGRGRVCLNITDANGNPITGSAILIRKTPAALDQPRNRVVTMEVLAGTSAKFGYLAAGEYAATVIPDDLSAGAVASYDIVVSHPS